MQEKAISIVGIMGVGKTCIAKKIAKQLNLPCVDTDREVKLRTKFSVSDLIKNNDENLLKNTEYDIIKEFSHKNVVISTGDYTVNNQAAWDYIIFHTTTIWMNISIQKIVKRLRPTENRPFLDENFDSLTLQKIYNQRKKRYKHAKIQIKNLNKQSIELLIDTLRNLYKNNHLIDKKITIINDKLINKL